MTKLRNTKNKDGLQFYKSSSKFNSDKNSSKYNKETKSTPAIKSSIKSFDESWHDNEEKTFDNKYYLELVSLDGRKFLFNIADRSLINFPHINNHTNQRSFHQEFSTLEPKIVNLKDSE